jgi:hypothetical protein
MESPHFHSSTDAGYEMMMADYPKDISGKELFLTIFFCEESPSFE